MSKLLVYDLETTGVKFWKNGIHQIAGMIIINGQEKDRFNFNVKPHPKAEIEDEALKVSGKTREDLESYAHMDQVHNDLCYILGKHVDKYDKKDKFHLAGFNNRQFDDQFLRAWFTQCNDQYFGSWFWSDSIDAMVLASFALQSQRSEMENFKLATVAKAFGIQLDPEKAHDAMYDLGITYQIIESIGVRQKTGQLF